MGTLLVAIETVWLVAGAAPNPVPVILDTDIGDDIDDTWALAMLLGCPQVDLKLIVTAVDDTPAKTRLVAKILEATGRADVPIGTGVKTSSQPLNQAAWLGDYSLEKYPGTVHRDGVQAMIDLIKRSPEPITLCVIGPETNLRDALDRDPGIAEKARIVAMAGSVHVGYGGAPGRVPEYNVRRDVEAAKAVFAAPWEITMAPLDSCGVLKIVGERFGRLAASQAPRAATVLANYNAWTNRARYPDNQSSILFDTVAAYLTFEEDFCEIETINLRVDDDGNTVPDESGRPVRCALRFKNRDALEELIVEALTGEPRTQP